MTKSWPFATTGIQVGLPGHGPNVAQIQTAGIVAMLDKQHLAVRAAFTKCTMTLPDGRVWVSSKRPGDNTVRENPSPVQIVMKVDVNSASGVGAATATGVGAASASTGWARLMDCDHLGNTDATGNAGGVSSLSHHGDTNGDMIVSYKGCATFDPTAPAFDGYGRPTAPGAGVDCTHNLQKLAAANGAALWTKAVPHTLHSCRAITDGSFFCGWTMSASDGINGTLDFGDGITVAGVDDTAGIIKYDGAGVAQWAKPTATTSFALLEVSHDGTLLAYYGSPPQSSGMSGSQVSRIDTSAGNEGNILWTDTDSGVGTHGFRDIAVTHDGREVLAYGQISGGEGDVMTDATGSSMTLRSRGVSDIFVACFDAATGAGKWALDGGGSDTEYFLGGIVADPSTNDIYVAGYTRCGSSPCTPTSPCTPSTGAPTGHPPPPQPPHSQNKPKPLAGPNFCTGVM